MMNGFRKIITTFIFLIVVSALLVFLAGANYLNKPNSAVASFYTPIAGALQGYSNDLYGFLDMISSIGTFKEENSRIKKENYELTQKISMLAEAERENEMLRKQLDFSDELCSSGTCLDWMMAKVIAKSPNSFEKYAIIDIGSDSGVKAGQAAVYSGGMLLGKITQVYEDTSRISLLTSSESSINVITQTSRSNGVVKGQYSTGVRLEMINQNEELKDGELIITSGLEDGIPKGLLIGRASRIEESANKIFKEANVDLFLDFNKVEEVFIAK
ncbi:MAG: rod shape-determining protein MreC [Candidatus Paceibacterota bacterium]|jgi:rod shape-determining protein MreC